MYIHGAFCANLSDIQSFLNWGLMDSAEEESWVLGLRGSTGSRGVSEIGLLWPSALWDPCRRHESEGESPAHDKVKGSPEVILVIPLLYKPYN